MKQLLLACFIALASPVTLADVWLNPGFYSRHLDRDKGFNNVNTGLGVEVSLTNTYSLTTGFFENTDRATSRYVGLYAMPFRTGHFKAGAAIGTFDGYPRMRDGGWFPAFVPTVAFEGRQLGLNVSFVPSISDRVHGAIAFQLKYNVTP